MISSYATVLFQWFDFIGSIVQADSNLYKDQQKLPKIDMTYQ